MPLVLCFVQEPRCHSDVVDRSPASGAGADRGGDKSDGEFGVSSSE
jgi:hypothetical protein